MLLPLPSELFYFFCFEYCLNSASLMFRKTDILRTGGSGFHSILKNDVFIAMFNEMATGLKIPFTETLANQTVDVIRD